MSVLRSPWVVLIVILVIVAGIWIVYEWRSHRQADLAVPGPAAARGVQAKFDQAEQYYYGRGVAQDFTKAAALYLECANQGFAPAMNSLGRLYELGQGVPKDLAQAKAWYQKAAALKNPDAQVALNTLGNWTVLIATDASIDYAKRWVANAPRAGLGAASVFVLNGKYLTTVGHYQTREQAEAALPGIRPKARRDAIAIDLTEWCPSSNVRNEAGLQVSVCRSRETP